jgi:hypothetical protein
MLRFIFWVCWFMPVLMFLAGTARAQSAGEQSAYVALYYTPVAGLPPLVPSMDTSSHSSGSSLVLHGRLGEMERRGGLSLKTMGVGIEMPMGHWNFSGTLAYLSASCGPDWAGDSDCDGDIMLGASARRTLLSSPIGEPPPAAKAGGKRPSKPSNNEVFLLGFEGSAGFSPRQGEQALALSAGLPLALSFRNGDTRITPFVTPGLGYGRLGHVTYDEELPDASYGSFAPMLGGGIGVQFGKSGVGATLGFQKVFKSDGGTTQFGVGMTWQGLTSSR